MKNKSPFYKTGPSYFGPGAMTPSVAAEENTSSDIKPATDESTESLARTRRQRKIDNLKGKLTDVKAQTMDLASKAEFTGDSRESVQKDIILGKHDQASRIEKRIARKEGRQERKAIRQSLKGKENRGERRKQIIESRQGQRKKVKSINNPKSKVTQSKSSSSKQVKNNKSGTGHDFGPFAKLGRAPSSQSDTVTLSAGRNNKGYSSKK